MTRSADSLTRDAAGQRTDPPLRVALVGCGWHARTTIIPALQQAGALIRATCARHLERAQEVASGLAGVTAHAGVDALLAARRDDIDACVLVLPPDGYEDAVKACLEAGVAVYCEKPAALDTATLRRLEAQAQQAAVPVMVGYMKRFAPAYTRALELVRADAFGRPIAVQARWSVGPGYRDVNYLLRENTTHILDILRYLVGEVDHVSAVASRADPDTVAVAAVLRFANGAVGTLEASSAGAWDHDNETLTVSGEGTAVIVDNVEAVSHRAPGEPERRWVPNHSLPVQRNSSLWVTGFTGAILHFARVVRGEEPCRSDISSAVRTMELAERIGAAATAPA